MVTSTVRAERASPVWALENILMPVLERAITEGTVIRPSGWSSAVELTRSLELLFGYGIEYLREGAPLTLGNLARALRMPNARVQALLGAVADWHWLIDNVRLSPSDNGSLGTAGSVMVLKGSPHLRSGANIFGVASRSIPEVVMKELGEYGLAPASNPPANCTATDCAVWLVEIGDGWSLVLRVEPLIERTWFDPERYEKGLRPYAKAALEGLHGSYPASNLTVLRERVLDSYLGSVKELTGDAGGLTFESGCLQHGELGKEVSYVGGRLEAITEIEGYGARALLDLPRLSPHDRSARRGDPVDPWSGQVKIGDEHCSFLLEGEDKPRSSREMAWAAYMPLHAVESPPSLRGVFRPASDRAMQEACADPERTRYVFGQAMVGKHGATRSQRVRVGFMIREYGGEVASGWSVPFGDVHTVAVQIEAIKQAEGHIKRMAPNGDFDQTVSYMRGAGIQESLVRVLPQIQARHGLILVSDILNTRAGLHI